MRWDKLQQNSLLAAKKFFFVSRMRPRTKKKESRAPSIIESALETTVKIWFFLCFPSCDCMLQSRRLIYESEENSVAMLSLSRSSVLSLARSSAGCCCNPFFSIFNQCWIFELLVYFYYFSISRQAKMPDGVCVCLRVQVCEWDDDDGDDVGNQPNESRRRSWEKKLWFSSSALHVVFRSPIRRNSKEIHTVGNSWSLAVKRAL